MNKSFLTVIITLFLSASCTAPELPDVQSLDKIADTNSSLLYDWDEESIKDEKSIPNQKDLDIKLNRKVSFPYKGQKYLLYPFFKKTSNNHPIAFLHFLLTEENLDIAKLRGVSFKDLTELDRDKAYYYYK